MEIHLKLPTHAGQAVAVRANRGDVIVRADYCVHRSGEKRWASGATYTSPVSGRVTYFIAFDLFTGKRAICWRETNEFDIPERYDH